VRTFLASAAVLAGAAFMLVAALGIVRLPDIYTRMQAATKAATVGVVGVMCGVAVALADAPVTARVALVSAFLLLTSPVAAHAIARAAHARGVPLAPGTRVDPGTGRRGERERVRERAREGDRAGTLQRDGARRRGAMEAPGDRGG
jgi:multicomponent Na+:H+ antiporter subunit G